MYLDKQKTKQLMNLKAGGNYNEFARKINVDPGHLHRILNTESNAGPKFLSKLAIYCASEDIDVRDYISFQPKENS